MSNIAILFIVEAKNLHFVIAKRIIRKNTLLDLENPHLTEFFEKNDASEMSINTFSTSFSIGSFCFCVIIYFNKQLKFH